jgi:predicted tellurium resistance membrane protein TerC
MTKLVATIFKTVNIFFVVLYLSTCLIPFLPAGTFWMVAFLGLIFPLLFLIVLAFFIIWLFARSRWCLLSLVALLLSWQQLSAFAGMNREEDFKIAKKRANTQGFNLATCQAGVKQVKTGTGSAPFDARRDKGPAGRPALLPGILGC